MKLAPENVEYIVIHSSHTKNPKPTDGVKILDKLHRMAGAFSWDLSGHACRHHFVIRTDGLVEAGRPLDITGNHTYGINERSVSVCYMGGITDGGCPADTRTSKQQAALKELVERLGEQFPNANAVCHCQIAPRTAKGCPGFSVEQL